MSYILNALPSIISEQWFSGVIFTVLFFTIVPINSIIIIILTSGTLSRLTFTDVLTLLHSSFNIIAGFLLPLQTMTLLYQYWTTNLNICYSLHVAEDAALGCSLVLLVGTLVQRWKSLLSSDQSWIRCTCIQIIATPIQLAMIVGLVTAVSLGGAYGIAGYMGYHQAAPPHTLVCLANIQILHGCRLLNAVTGTIELMLCVLVVLWSAIIVTCNASSCTSGSYNKDSTSVLETSELMSDVDEKTSEVMSFHGGTPSRPSSVSSSAQEGGPGNSVDILTGHTNNSGSLRHQASRNTPPIQDQPSNPCNGNAVHPMVFQCTALDIRPRSHTAEGVSGKEQARSARERTNIARTSSIPLTSILRDHINPLVKMQRPSQLSFGITEYRTPHNDTQDGRSNRFSVTTLQIEIDGSRKARLALKLALTTAALVLMVLPHTIVKLYASIDHDDPSIMTSSLAAYAVTKWLRIGSVAVLPTLIILLNSRLMRRLKTLYNEAPPIMHQKRLNRPSIRSTTSV